MARERFVQEAAITDKLEEMKWVVSDREGPQELIVNG
jgi:hypothetical protein